MIAVYVHIPFCRTLCSYCDFVRYPAQGDVPEIFIDALCGEIASFDGPREIRSVFFGGGTPSLLGSGELERVFEALASRFTLAGAEITIEANPDDVDASLTAAWKSVGINRVSLGIQSFDDSVLRNLGRRHNALTARHACEQVASGFDHWGMDLIFGASPIDTWEDTLDQCTALEPKHVSCYGLTYESGTPFAARAHEAVDDDTWLALYRRAEVVLKDFVHYEISNFARAGFECQHNLVYWQNEEYAGFGPGAYAFLDGVRSRNQTRLQDYLISPGQKQESLLLAPHEVRLETVIQHFRLKRGLGKSYYRKRFGRDVRDDFGAAIVLLLARGLLEEDGDTIHPTISGFELNNEIGLALVK